MFIQKKILSLKILFEDKTKNKKAAFENHTSISLIMAYLYGFLAKLCK